jgi:transposase-like protein
MTADRLPYDGCHIHQTCLSCPRRWCIYDDPEPPVAKTTEVQEAAAALRLEGLSIDAVSRALGVHPRTIQRWRGRGVVA